MIKKYIIFSLILILLIGGFVYMNTDSYFTFSILGVNITLPVAVWSMVFLGFFALFSVVFLFIGHIRNYFFMKNYEKDVKNLLFNIKAKLLKKKALKEVKLKELKEINDFIKGVDGLEIKKGYGEFEKIIDDLLKIKNNEYVDLSKYKLDNNNEWVKLNSKNEIESFDKTQLVKILKKQNNDELTKLALIKYSQIATFKEIMKFDNYQFNKEIIFNIIKNNDLSYKDVIALIEKTKPQIKDIKLFDNAEFSDKDYLELALLIDEKYSPDELMEIFKDKDLAYVYILIKYEMIDKARDIVKDKDLEFFEDYFVCRDCGKKVDIKEYAKDRLQRN